MDRRIAERSILAAALATAAVPGCRFDPAYRDELGLSAAACTAGVVECRGTSLVRCDAGTPTVIDDCGARKMACAPGLLACTPCLPNAAACDGNDVVQCDAHGQQQTKLTTCDTGKGLACRGGACLQLCDEAARTKSNVGCEYWGVDLDNAAALPPDPIDQSGSNAAAQQYAIIVSNPQPDLPANVTVEEDDAKPGEPAALRVVATATVGVQNLEVFKLGPREVDGSPPDKPNGGTGTALSRGAFRVTSTVPIVAWQFNPLENVNVRSNDATILLPTAALNQSGRAYVVAGWPQTLAKTSDPATNSNFDLRAFLTLVGTSANTTITLKTAARIIPGGPFADGVDKGATVHATLQPFDVLNLETGDFNADFSGSTIDSNQPVVVYVGSEASDAPYYTTLADRRCCADHLESQVTPVRAVGKTYVLPHMPNRVKAVAAAGGVLAPFAEPELYRVVAVTSGTTNVTTSLAPPWDSFTLNDEGGMVTIASYEAFTLRADKPVLVADVQVSQEAAGISIDTHARLPGGDPSLMLVPAIEQWRSDYVLLTPDKYAFDFLVIAAPFGATVYVDGLVVDGKVCEVVPGDGLDAKKRGTPSPPFVVYRCQLSFPVVVPDADPPNNVLPGKQNDGVHRVVSDFPVGVSVYGFDYRVSYAYAGGTDLVDIQAN
jgi:hypothetical protein